MKRIKRIIVNNYCFCLFDIYLFFYYVIVKGSYLKVVCLFCIVSYISIRDVVVFIVCVELLFLE